MKTFIVQACLHPDVKDKFNNNIKTSVKNIKKQKVKIYSIKKQ